MSSSIAGDDIFLSIYLNDLVKNPDNRINTII